ncbi:MAG TPA: ABC transporter substrate-binding protein [Arenicellales bacterium]|jgi:branched-chain amino acid transport system substrate-binding protein|nr:ABC transporter permease [Acidiferrobacteraceae bacterium]MDP6136204.1 ABC transporter substrate-binding protein [Arenicellales bacterium]HJP09061.1 ABC transporter substrate-binding protein [Arenicellales bacterium]|tara:strand:+ start:79 stop:1404 length:1326 start_codon:yes stop_codon:yes gene_type:complete
MRMKNLMVSGLLATLVMSPFVVTTASAADDHIYMAGLSYRTGPYAPNGVPFGNGFKDYLTMLNERDGGVGGVPIVYEECEMGYNTKIAVECYEKLKGKRPQVIIPNSTGVTYQLIPKTMNDEIPLFTMGYGRTSAAVGSVFPWVFNFPTTYWSQATAVIRYIGEEMGGMDQLKGKRIAHVFHNSAYGKEANPTLQVLSEKFGFDLMLLAVDHPGQEQKATWLQIRKKKPDYVFMSGWGIMNSTAMKEAAAINYPMDRFIGNWWSGSENDVMPAGVAADGYRSATFHVSGAETPLHKDIKKYVYDKGLGGYDKADVNRIYEVLYIRGLLNHVFAMEAVRRAQEHFGVKVPSGEQTRWGLENMHMTDADWQRVGLPGFPEIKVSCNDHEGGHPVLFQRWDANAKKWSVVSDWIPTMRDLVRPMMEADAAKYAAENNITPRDCG